MSDSEVDRIARALAEQRRLDETLAPDFDSLLNRPRPRPRDRRWARAGGARPVLALAATLLLAAGSIWFASRSRSTSHAEVAGAAASIGGWKAPTDSLLETPGAELLNETPALVPPLPDYSWIANAKSDGVRTPPEKS